MKSKQVRALILAILILSLPLLLWSVYIALPYKGLKTFISRQYSTRFYDRNGQLLYIMPLEQGLRREWIALEDIPEKMREAFIEAEDKRFYSHHGVDFMALVRAAFLNGSQKRIVSGASTITMQLVRIISPRQKNPSIMQKSIEVIKALKLEKKISKNRILELYLNSVPFGYQIEGVASAARSFYALPPQELSGEQIERLATVPRKPSLYAPSVTFSYPSFFPHFILYAIDALSSDKKIIPTDVYLSIDKDLCDAAELLIRQKLELHKGQRIHNGSALVIDNHTGEILVWIGNQAFLDAEHSGQIDGVLVKNQMGSSMKPFLYALALEKGFLPTSILPDIPQDFGSERVYAPVNFNNRYNGPVPFRVSLASSLNVPAVYLLQELGLETYLSLLYALGFSSLKVQEKDLGLSLALGAGEVSLYELTRAFSVFPNDGALLKKLNIQRHSENEDKSRVYKEDTARIICDILSDRSARSLGFGDARVFAPYYPAIFKTGTSNQFQNIVALGATSNFTVGVWMGNFEGSTVVRETGSSVPASVVRSLLDSLSALYGAENFRQPKEYVKKPICSLSGTSPSPFCHSVTMEYIPLSMEASFSNDKKCTWHTQWGINYPSIYQHWAFQKSIDSSFIEEDVPVIQYPKNDAVFVYDPSLPQEVQYISVLATGGTANGYEGGGRLFYDGIFMGEKTHPLKWQVPLERGRHTLRFECNGHTDSVFYLVR